MRVLIMTLMLFASTSLPAADRARLITLAADEWCPYNCAPQSAKPGYVVEIAREIFADEGYRVEYQSLPWARALKAVEQGRIQGAIGASPVELPDAVFPDEEIGQFRAHFFVAKGSRWRYQGTESLNRFRLGVVNEYDYGGFNYYIEQHRNSNRLLELSGNDAGQRGLHMVARGRLDAFLDDRDVAWYTAKRLEIEPLLEEGGAVGQPINIYIAFSAQEPNAAHYARLLSDGIREMRRNGRLAAILASYGLSDWK